MNVVIVCAWILLVALSIALFRRDHPDLGMCSGLIAVFLLVWLIHRIDQEPPANP